MKADKRAAERFLDECRAGLSAARQLLPQVLAAPEPHTVASTLAPYHRLLVELSRSSALAGLYSEVHPDELVRDAARTCEQEVSAFATELSLHRGLYEALAAIDPAPLDDETLRFLDHTLRDFRRAGVDRDADTRARIQQINDDVTRIGQQFAKAISEDVRAVVVTDEARLAGLPADWIAGHRGADGTFRITTDYPDYNPLMMYADDDALRRELYVAFRCRGGTGNEGLLQELLGLRAELAALLGRPSYADLVTEDKMMGSAVRAAEFIERVWQLARPRAARDYADLLAQLRTVRPDATRVDDWQKSWLETRIKKEHYQVDAQEVRAYFPFEAVLAGLLDITAEIYDLRYVPVPDAPVWHPSVRVHDVVRGDARIGRIYLDMHPRDGKYKHAAQFTLVDGVEGVQLPEGVLVCNFPAEPPALMEHDDVVTMFHEFGHLMHHVLGGHHRWIKQSGVATEWDFVEAPSQMFEEWAWSHATLARFARHHETGAPIPAELVARMRKADQFGVGTQTVQQMFYAAISLGFHTADPARLDQVAEVRRLQEKYTPFAFVEGTRFHASFGHLVGYSAMYYTYMWSLVIAKDLLTPFAERGLMDLEATRRYRDTVLVPGGTRDARDLVRAFLGRDFDFAAFEKYLAE